jgi:acetyltransferase-like isoleucine patch superfamily enzyme
MPGRSTSLADVNNRNCKEVHSPSSLASRVRIGLARRLQAGIDTLRLRVARHYLVSRGVRCGPRLEMRSLPLCSRHPLAHIEIGADVIILNKLQENPAGIVHPTVLVASSPGARLKIGNHVGMSGAIIFCTNEITIEDYVSIGVDCRIYDTDFHPLDAGMRRVRDRTAIASAPVRMCEDAFIGARAVILKGVTVGARSVVGAGAVVTRDVPPDTVAVGVPARAVATIGSSHRHDAVDRGNPSAAVPPAADAGASEST